MVGRVVFVVLHRGIAQLGKQATQLFAVALVHLAAIGAHPTSGTPLGGGGYMVIVGL